MKTELNENGIAKIINAASFMLLDVDATAKMHALKDIIETILHEERRCDE